MIFLKLFGGASLEDEGGALTGPAAQRHRLALLALLAASPSRALTRDRLMSLLWPERDAEHARKLLNQAVYALRKSLGQDALLSAGDELRLETGLVRCDVVAFEEALAEAEWERSVELYTGSFLDGFHLSDSPEFERWVDAQRARLSGACAEALEQLAEGAEVREDYREAVGWWSARAALDPYDSRVALQLTRAMVIDGNPAGALRHAAIHERLLREELGIEPPVEISALAERLRREPDARPQGRGGLNPLVERPEHPAEGAGRPAGTAVPPPRPALPLEPKRSRTPSTPRSTPGRLLPYGLAAFLLLGLILAASRLGLTPAAERGPAAERPGIATEELASVVARELDRRLRGDIAARPPEQRTRSIAARELHLRASDPAFFRSAGAARQALEYHLEAVRLDSTYAAAWAGLALFSARVSGDVGEAETDRSREELHALAEEAALRAVALDGSFGEAHAVLGLVRMGAFDFRSAEAHLQRALALDPAHPYARKWLATAYLWTGRPAEALAAAERALELHPLSASATAEVARALAGNGRCDEALARLERLEGVQPPLLRVAQIAARCHVRNGSWREAVEVLRSHDGADADPSSSALLGHLLARAGQREEALRIRAKLLRGWRDGGMGAFPVAIVDAGLGDPDRAFVWLDRAVEDRSLAGWPHHHTIMDIIGETLGDDARFERLRERLRLVARKDVALVR